MNSIFNKIIGRIKNNIREVHLESALIALALSVGIIIVGSNIIRVYSNGKNNYSTFIQENIEKDKLQAKNNKLQEEYDYVNSDEYKKLFLRDSKNLAENNEELYSTKEKPKYYEEVPEYLDIKTKSSYTDWWKSLLAY